MRKLLPILLAGLSIPSAAEAQNWFNFEVDPAKAVLNGNFYTQNNVFFQMNGWGLPTPQQDGSMWLPANEFFVMVYSRSGFYGPNTLAHNVALLDMWIDGPAGTKIVVPSAAPFDQWWSTTLDDNEGVMQKITVGQIQKTNFATGIIANASVKVGVFTIAAAVPEPATWAMMIGGFGLIGASLRARRRRVVYA